MSLREQFVTQCRRAQVFSERQNTPLRVVLGRGGATESGEPYETCVHIMGGVVTDYVWERYAAQGRRYRTLRTYLKGKQL